MATLLDQFLAIAEQIPFNEEEAKARLSKLEALDPKEEANRYEAWLRSQRKPLTPRQAAIADMKAEGLDTSVLELRRTVIVVEVEDYVFRSIDDGRILNGGRRVKKTIIGTI